MIKKFVDCWEAHKHDLEVAILQDIESMEQDIEGDVPRWEALSDVFSYKNLIFHILNKVLIDDMGDPLYDYDQLTVIDNGDYQGTFIFIAPEFDCYQPGQGDYMMTFVGYGSCAGCDIMEDLICSYDKDYPEHTAVIVTDMMQLALHIIQRMIIPWSEENFEYYKLGT